ncbi:uncharacterized protein LOC128737566 isoform X2 [Sabethes cyaneus]|uniref:uncharacterized protein LOC128737566 isoform X2 n=1 Tax=Sabethes cyaneus TaxID=53552 RepID=UPI00237E1F11|nr:uncharacterized protein LOC128737566 isoform X2 [Sabethes cyaneus]
MDIEIKDEPVIIEGYELIDTADSYNLSNEACSSKDSQQSFENDEMLILLRQWGLEILSERFTKNLIDVSLLDYILEVDIMELCKDLPMRYRLILRHKLEHKYYKNQQHKNKNDDGSGKSVNKARPDTTDSMVNYNSAVKLPVPRFFYGSKRESLLEICEVHETGRKFLEQYKKENGKRIYPAESRKYIKNAVVDYFYRCGNGHIVSQTFPRMVQIILDELPDEDPGIWYIPKDNNHAAAGLLYTRYKYLLQKDYNSRSQKNSNTVVAPAATEVPAEQTWLDLPENEQLKCSAAKRKLQNVSNIDKIEVHAAWRDSFPLRRYEVVSKKLRLEEWSVLASLEENNALINYDFCTLHSAEHDTFREKVPQFVTLFKDVSQGYKAQIEDDRQLYHVLTSLNFQEGSEDSDKANFLTFYSLPLILRQNFIGKGRKRIKPSLKSCRTSFIVLIEKEQDLPEAIAQRKQMVDWEHEGNPNGPSTPQPFIIAIGDAKTYDISKYFVIWESIVFKCKTVVEALDLMFKLHAVFELDYSQMCQTVMKFIQKYFYDLATDTKRLDAKAAALITDLNRSAN